MLAWLGITTIAAPFYRLRLRRLRPNPVDYAGGENRGSVHGCRANRLGKLAIRDRKLKRSRFAFRRVLFGTEEFTLGALGDGLVFELGSVARRVTVVVLDRAAARDNEAALANLRQGGLGVGGNLGLIAELGPTVMRERVP